MRWALVLVFVACCALPAIEAQSKLNGCYLLTDSSGRLSYLNATAPASASILAVPLALSPECTTIVSTAFDNSSTIFASCTGRDKGVNYTKVYAFDLSGKQIDVLPDPLPLCRGSPTCKMSWLTYDTVHKTLYARLDMGVSWFWIPSVISWNSTSNAWTFVASLPEACSNPFSAILSVSGVVDTANQRLIGNCEMNTIFDLDISSKGSSPREVFLWDVQDFRSPLFIYPSAYDKGSDISALAFASTFLNSQYAPVTQSMSLDRMKLRKQKWNTALGAATPRVYTPIASTYQHSTSIFNTVNFVTTESYQSISYYLMVQIDFRSTTVSLFPQLNRQPVTLPMQYYGDAPTSNSQLTGVHILESCPPHI